MKEIVELDDERYGLENEIQDDTEDGEDGEEYPYQVEDIRIDQKMISLYQVIRWIEQEKLILRPEYQRNFVWDRKKQSLLIESLMLKIPIPAFYFDESIDGIKTVIDGMQRLTTISRFMNNEFKLTGLQYIKECEDKRFQDLEIKYQSRIEDTQLAVNILDARCPYLVKFDVFRRINTGGVQLQPQEIRNIIASPETRNLLSEMVNSNAFLAATQNTVNDIRMGAQELALRYIAYRNIYDFEKKDFITFGEMSKLLDKTIVKVNEMPQKEKDCILSDFIQSMEKCHALFGDSAFSKPQRKYIVNRALFVSYSIVMDHCKLKCETLKEKSAAAIKLLEEKLNSNKNYYNAITSSTSSRRNMYTQIYFAIELMEELFDDWKTSTSKL
ncbi:MAG: DUF262 domain-containing protein [Lachnospiraceae bacterium]|nr:DUF262 domain-containing protein [Lachnospiraceae bacterium]